MISPSKGTRIIKKLVCKNLVEVHQINLGGRGGSAKYLELTEKGYETIRMKPKLNQGRGAGFEHTFWQHSLKERLAKIDGVRKVSIEGILNG